MQSENGSKERFRFHTFLQAIKRLTFLFLHLWFHSLSKLIWFMFYSSLSPWNLSKGLKILSFWLMVSFGALWLSLLKSDSFGCSSFFLPIIINIKKPTFARNYPVNIALKHSINLIWHQISFGRLAMYSWQWRYLLDQRTRHFPFECICFLFSFF